MMKLMRRFFGVTALCALMAACYVAVPFWTAWSIREAIKSSDSAYLQDKIEWGSVRATLKESLGKFAFTPSGELTEAIAKPGLWQRIKSYVGQGALDRFVESTITPTGMAGLLAMRKSYQANISGEDAATRPPVWVRMSRVWSRVTRAEFTSVQRFEMDMIDKQAPGRTINCVLELRGLGWKMTELRVKTTEPSKLATMKAQAM